ncbi:hypothetical protein F5X99DRAFT_232526 [Biscogniauxia marginata]|nr:hypothetical protein F5X99DRAFT_232526 [Biscogniauxia marginata]
MGNSPSVEASGRGSKAAHKLSKPRTGNVATAGLLCPKALPDSTQHFTSNPRRFSQLSGSTSAPSPKLPEKDAETMASIMGGSSDGEPGDRSSRRISRPDPSQEPRRHQQRSNSVGVIASPQVRCRPIRANSVNIGPEESYAAHFNLQSLSKNGSRISFTYDIASYEARQLLNLAEEPFRESSPRIPDNHSQVSETAWKSNPGSHRPSVSSTAPSLPRAHSDVSLYTPMRRKSLMTPGVATRTAPTCPAPSIPPKSRARYSLPSTPSRRDSLESTGPGIVSLAPSVAGPDLIPRALTPSEAEYKQTGAFKLGTLRITNGSPVTSPTADSSDDEDDKQGPKQPSKQGGHYHGELKVVSGNVEEASFTTIGTVGGEERLVHPSPIKASSLPMLESRGSILTTATKEPMAKLEAPGQFSPDLVHSPLPISGADLESSELQVTSKHTAAEDQLFEDEPEEYYAEILDIRVDPSAKSTPPRPRLLSNDQESKDISRSDSGIVASPTSVCSKKPLSKADSGYSSNVSIRSLSSKVRGQEKDAPQVSSSGTPSEIPHGVSIPVVTQTVTRSIPNVTISKPEETVETPLLEKVCATLVPTNQRASQELPAASRRKLRLLGSKSSLKKSVVPVNGNIEPSEVSPLPSTSSSAGSTSSLSSGVTPRKLGKLQRLLSGTRVPLSAHFIHRTEKPDIPPTPKDTQAKLHGQSRLLPVSLKRFTLKPEPSKETLGTIMSVGSAELLSELETPATQGVRDNRQSSSRREVKTRKRRSTMHAHSISSTISRAASALSRKPTTKRAVPRQVDPEHYTADYSFTSEMRENDEAQATSRTTMGQSIVGETWDVAYLGTAIEGRNYVDPVSKRSRSASITVQIERNLRPSSATFQPSEKISQGEPRSPTSLGVPRFASHITGSRTPPPVSMRTRNMGSLQALPPTRPRSTPPGTVRARSGPSLSRRGSRENNHSNAPIMDPATQNRGIIAWRPSRENANNYSVAQADAYSNVQSQEPSLDPRRFTSFRNQFRASNWEAKADYDPSLSRQSSFDRNRHNYPASRPSHRGQRSLSIAAPGSFQRQQQQSNPPILKSRSSHDGFGCLQPENYVRDNGPYPTMVRANGQKLATDPWSGQPVIQRSQQLDLSGQYPSHATYRRFRHRSFDRNMPEAPYRVLHSYNSPAYRNVPVWG